MIVDKKNDGPRFRPPRDGLVREQSNAESVRFIEAASADTSPVLAGHFAVKNTWTEINSMFEGNFMERIADGAFKKTFNDNAQNIRVTFNHGHDVLGDQALGRIASLQEDSTGAYYEVELFRSLPPLLMEGLAAGQYGASFRFKVMREDIVDAPGKSDHNPKALPERTIKEAMVAEFGPVTFPAYPEATAGIRSATDEYIMEQFVSDPGRVKALLGNKPKRSATNITVNGLPYEPRASEPSTPDGLRSHLSSAHTTNVPGDMTMPDMQTTHASMHASGSDHSHQGMASASAAPAPDTHVATPTADAPSEDRAAIKHPEPERREEPEATQPEPERTDTVDSNKTLEELRSRVEEIGEELQRMDADAGTGVLNETQQAEWDSLKTEREEIRTQIVAKQSRMADLEQERAAAAADREVSKPRTSTRTEAGSSFNFNPSRTEDDIYDLSTVRGAYDNPDFARRELRDRALQSIEKSSFPQLGRRASKEDMQGHAVDLLDTLDDGVLAQRMLLTGHPLYERAFWKRTRNPNAGLTRDEQNVFDRAERALATSTAGYAMPYTLDPTVLLTSNGAINPIRQLANVVQVSGQTWNGVNSAGITASFDGEAVEVSDDTPTLTQPTVTVLKAAAFVPYSIESENWTDLRNEITSEIADSKDVLEAQKFTLGTGTAEPTGFMQATNLATTAGTASIALSDLDTFVDSLVPRFQANAAMLASRKFYSKVRQLSRTAGVTEEWAPTRQGFPADLLGAPKYEASDVVSTLTSSSSLVAAYGDFRKGFLIVDRVGLNVEGIPHLFNASNHRPSGSRGIYAYWMTNSIIRSQAALRLLKVL